MSELTKERLKELRSERDRLLIKNAGTFPAAMELACKTIKLIDELLALRSRDVGDDKVDGEFRVALQGEFSHTDQKEAVIKLHGFAITRGQQLREARAEIERLKCESQKNFMAFTQEAMKSGVKTELRDQETQSLRSQIATLTAERDEARKEGLWVRKKLDLPEDCEFTKLCGAMHVVHAHAHGYVTYIKTYKCEDKDGQIARLTVENGELKDQIDALKSCPAMAEVDAVLLKEPETGAIAFNIRKFTKMLETQKASREEVVELLKWLDEFWDFKEVKKCLCEYASDKVYGDDQQKARRILEIVEGK